MAQLDRRSCLGLLSSGLLAAPPSPPLDESGIRAMLHSVGEAYSGADRCRISAKCTANLDAGLGLVQTFAIARNGPLFRFERTTVVRTVFVIGQDAAWEYRPFQFEYIVHPPSAERSDEIRTVVKKHFFDLAGRFPVVARIDADRSFEGWKNLTTAAGRLGCALIKLASKDRIWSEKLWIDPASSWVWKSEMHRKPHQEGGKLYADTLTTTTWTQIEIGEPPGPELFVFRPRTGDKQVTQFSASQGRG